MMQLHDLKLGTSCNANCDARHYAWQIMVLTMLTYWLITGSCTTSTDSTSALSSTSTTATSHFLPQECAQMKFVLFRPVTKWTNFPADNCPDMCKGEFDKFDQEMRKRLAFLELRNRMRPETFNFFDLGRGVSIHAIPLVDQCEATPSVCYGEKRVFVYHDIDIPCASRPSTSYFCAPWRFLSCQCRVLLILPMVYHVTEKDYWLHGARANINGFQCSPGAILSRLNLENKILNWQADLDILPGNIEPRRCDQHEQWPLSCSCMHGDFECRRVVELSQPVLQDQRFHEHRPLDHFVISKMELEFNNLELGEFLKMQHTNHLPVVNVVEPMLLKDIPYYFQSEAAVSNPLAAASTSSAPTVLQLIGQQVLDNMIQPDRHLPKESELTPVLIVHDLEHEPDMPFLRATTDDPTSAMNIARINQILLLASGRNGRTGNDLALLRVLVGALTRLEETLNTLGEDTGPNSRFYVPNNSQTRLELLSTVVARINKIFNEVHEVNRPFDGSALRSRLFECMARSMEADALRLFPHTHLADEPEHMDLSAPPDLDFSFL